MRVRLAIRWPALLVIVLGSLLSLAGYLTLREEADSRWREAARRDIARISDIVLYRLELLDGPVLGLSMLIRGSSEVNHNEFFDALALLGGGETTTDDIGFATVQRQANGSLRVILSSDDEPYLIAGRDLGGRPEVEATLKRLHKRPEKVQMGPAFLDDDGHYKILLGFLLAGNGHESALLALADLTELFQDLATLHTPNGLYLFPETDGLPPDGILSMARAEHDPIIESQVVRTQSAGAEWRLHWEMHAAYGGGPEMGLARAALFGGLIMSILAGLVMDMLVIQRLRAHELDSANERLRTANLSLRNALDQLVRTEKLASLGALVAGIAHELNTPIGNSLTVATTLREKTTAFARALEDGALRKSVLNDFVDTATRAADLVEHNIQRASELVGNFKQVAVDQTSARRRQFDLREVVEEVLWTLTPTLKHLPHHVELAIAQGIMMDSYPGPLGQILTNFVTNSLTHAFNEQNAGLIRIEAEPGHDKVALRYRDNGAGIDPANLGKIFDPFFTTKLGSGGSGLGLHIVYNLVTGILGGHIHVASARGQGTVFELVLPLVAPEAGTEERP